MTFLGIVAIQVQISDLTAEVVIKQEAFVEFSQYRFVTEADTVMRLLSRRESGRDEMLPEEEAFIYYPLSKDPSINAKYVSNSNKVWDFMRKVKNIPGVYIESITSTGINRKGEHDGSQAIIHPILLGNMQ